MFPFAQYPYPGREAGQRRKLEYTPYVPSPQKRTWEDSEPHSVDEYVCRNVSKHSFSGIGRALTGWSMWSRKRFCLRLCLMLAQ